MSERLVVWDQGGVEDRHTKVEGVGRTDIPRSKQKAHCRRGRRSDSVTTWKSGRTSFAQPCVQKRIRRTGEWGRRTERKHRCTAPSSVLARVPRLLRLTLLIEEIFGLKKLVELERKPRWNSVCS